MILDGEVVRTERGNGSTTYTVAVAASPTIATWSSVPSAQHLAWRTGRAVICPYC